MENYDQFTNIYPVQKTIRFELKPQGRTSEHLECSKFFEEDRERAEKYKVLKKIIDDYHRGFINECLQTLSLDWDPLKEALESYHSSKEEKDKKKLESEQKRMRGEIVKAFKSDKRFEDLFSKKLFSDLLKPEIFERGDPEEIAALNRFDKFFGYFSEFHKNRENIYSGEAETTAVSNRIVNENFPIFLDNLQKYQGLRKDYPELIKDAESALTRYNINMDEIFSLDHFNAVMRQDGIERYNLAIGGYVTDAGEKIRGLNEGLNLLHQHDSSIKKMRFFTLYKQILSDRSSFSYILDSFSEDSQVLSSIDSFFADVENEKEENILDRIVELMSSYSKFDISKIYVSQTDLNRISMEITGEWDKLGGMMRTFKAESLGDGNIEKTSKKIDVWLNSKEFPLSDVISAMTLSESNETFEKYVSKIAEVREQIRVSRKETETISGKISGDEDSIRIIKSVLDSVQKLLHLIRPFRARSNLPLDADFYAEYNEMFDRLSAIVPLYNKIRNFLTKTNLSTSKVKLNFKNPTLANGWDLNKEFDNTAVIFIRDGKYYLGIMDPSKKKSIKFEGRPDAVQSYQKMVYKQLPGPIKMLPKVFFSEKGKETYCPPRNILEGYKAGKHKKGDNFDLTYCRQLIDFYKESIDKNADWKIFDFKFSPTESYEDINEFYKEVEKQGYKISFVNIPAEVIDGYVENGELFLFQIYNKDFAKGAKGRKNMHTMYWDAIFSPENLKNIVVKLNGEAELFYRDKSDVKKISHKEGEMLVNRTCLDKTPIPDKIHKELFDYYQGGCKNELGEAKDYVDKVRAFEAKYEIIKDRRYLEDKMYFHVPVTLNFKADGKKNLNKMVIEKFLTDENAHIIGIDRGERNLLYLCVIDRTGKIIFQESLNIIDGFDYYEKLNQREIERRDARESWNSIGKIKDLKEGYLSKAVHKIVKMAIEYNAVIVLEDLNFGFKRGRFKVEKQIYQKFESMLIDKLNYLVFKETPEAEIGGVLKAYQLTNPLESFSKLGKQSGILFYVPAAYTSKIDPTTGFVNLFNTSGITNMEGRKKFLLCFDSITYSVKDGGIFAFRFNYRKFGTLKSDYKNNWTVYTNGVRMKYDKTKKSHVPTEPTKKIKEALSSCGIRFDDGHDLREDITQDSSNNVLINALYFSFLDTIQMRNRNGEEDYIISPVKNCRGEFFRTDNTNEDLPKDADANGSYNIALKGELLMRMIDPETDRVNIPRIEHKDWFEFMQIRGDK